MFIENKKYRIIRKIKIKETELLTRYGTCEKIYHGYALFIMDGGYRECFRLVGEDYKVEEV